MCKTYLNRGKYLLYITGRYLYKSHSRLNLNGLPVANLPGKNLIFKQWQIHAGPLYILRTEGFKNANQPTA